MLCYRLGAEAGRAGAVSVALDALCDVGILDRDGDGCRLSNFTGKTDLTACEILRAVGYQ